MEYVLFHWVFTSRINFLYLTCNFSAKANSSSSFLGDLLISITKALTLSIIGCNFFNPAFTTRAIVCASHLMTLNFTCNSFASLVESIFIPATWLAPLSIVIVEAFVTIENS